ncbi:MAG: (2Fe-2S) ferredoxin domain-containing protein, partial [Clostridia bacterium]|nr:(2Fe-2S) ferredoxin domain-containing protein [Clostridia bacterium]
MTHKLNSRSELNALRNVCRQALAAEKTKILVCGGTGCVAGGSLDIYAKLQELLKEKEIPAEVELAEEPHGEVVGVKKSGCHGFCEMGPLVRIDPNGWLYTKVKLTDCEEIIDETVVNGRFIERLGYKKEGAVIKKQEEIPFYNKQTRMVLESCGHINAGSIREYL